MRDADVQQEPAQPTALRIGRERQVVDLADPATPSPRPMHPDEHTGRVIAQQQHILRTEPLGRPPRCDGPFVPVVAAVRRDLCEQRSDRRIVLVGHEPAQCQLLRHHRHVPSACTAGEVEREHVEAAAQREADRRGGPQVLLRRTTKPCLHVVATLVAAGAGRVSPSMVSRVLERRTQRRIGLRMVPVEREVGAGEAVRTGGRRQSSAGVRDDDPLAQREVRAPDPVTVADRSGAAQATELVLIDRCDARALHQGGQERERLVLLGPGDRDDLDGDASLHDHHFLPGCRALAENGSLPQPRRSVGRARGRRRAASSTGRASDF